MNNNEIIDHIWWRIKCNYESVIYKKSPHNYIFSIEFYKKSKKSKDNAMHNLKLDLEKFLFNDSPLNLKFENIEYSYALKNFFQDLMSPIYYSDSRNIPIDVKTFEKIIKIFDDLLVSTSIESLLPTFSNADVRSNKFHLELTKEILSVNNYIYYQDKDLSDFWLSIKREFEVINKFYKNEKSNILKEGLINYLNNRKIELEVHKNKDDETLILNIIKKILHCDHWAELASYLPSYKIELLSTSNTFNISDNPVYCINLSKNDLLQISKSTFTDYDFYQMMNLIRESLNLTKPNGIDSIELSNAWMSWREEYTKWENPRIYLSGEIMTKQLANKIIQLFNQMIIEYNSDNIYRDMNCDWETLNEKYENNKLFLNKIAEILWLNMELEDEKTETKKVNKI